MLVSLCALIIYIEKDIQKTQIIQKLINRKIGVESSKTWKWLVSVTIGIILCWTVGTKSTSTLKMWVSFKWIPKIALRSKYLLNFPYPVRNLWFSTCYRTNYIGINFHFCLSLSGFTKLFHSFSLRHNFFLNNKNMMEIIYT